MVPCTTLLGTPRNSLAASVILDIVVPTALVKSVLLEKIFWVAMVPSKDAIALDVDFATSLWVFVSALKVITGTGANTKLFSAKHAFEPGAGKELSSEHCIMGNGDIVEFILMNSPTSGVCCCL
jgi:hypothetical protein